MTTYAVLTDQGRAYLRWLDQSTPEQQANRILAFAAGFQARDEEVAALTAERDASREELRVLVNDTDWIDGRCVIRQAEQIGSGGALDRAMAALIAWSEEVDGG